MKTILECLAAIAAAAVLLRLGVLLLEPRLAFYPLRGASATPRALGIPYEEIVLRTVDGEAVIAWLLPHPHPRAEIVFWHGNGGNLSTWLDVLAAIREQGFSVLALDYRGYGKSSGRPSEKGLYRDTSALVRHFAEEIHQPPNRVVYWGRSLGAVMAAYAATLEKPDGLILEAGFPDARFLLRRDPLLSFLALFSTYRFPTAKFLRGLGRPILLLHPERDDVVPLEQGRELYRRLEGDRRLVVIGGATHNDVMPADRADYWPAVLDFVEGLRPR